MIKLKSLLEESKQSEPINESIIAAIVGIVGLVATTALGAELFSDDASGEGMISRAIADIKRKWKGEPTSSDIWKKVVRDDEIRKYVRDNAKDIVKRGKNYKSKELEDLIIKYLDTEKKK